MNVFRRRRRRRSSTTMRWQRYDYIIDVKVFFFFITIPWYTWMGMIFMLLCASSSRLHINYILTTSNGNWINARKFFGFSSWVKKLYAFIARCIITSHIQCWWDWWTWTVEERLHDIFAWRCFQIMKVERINEFFASLVNCISFKFTWLFLAVLNQR